MKMVLPWIKKLLKENMHKRIINNYFKKNHSKQALLSYILTPFQHNFFSHILPNSKIKNYPFAHTNFFEAFSWAKILDELGFNVDIIDFRNSRKIDITKYDLICGFGEVFQQVFESVHHKKIWTITYATGMNTCYSNAVSLLRVKDVYNKKGVWLGKSSRYVEKGWTHSVTLVDGIIALGNEVCADTYKRYYDGPVYSLPAPFYEVLNGYDIINRREVTSKKHYLWFGSSGLIHKGLDLCLDYFSKNQDLFLHVCGPIENERDFVEVYKRELFSSPNIILHGFVDITSKKFEEILSLCSFVIFPSCSEGGSPSVITAVGNGGLIPIITKETTIRTGFEIWIEGFNYESIEKAVRQSQSLTFEEIRSLQLSNLSYVKNNHNQEVYYKRLKEYIQRILRVGDEY